MKLLYGALAYLAVVGTLVVATISGISSVERNRPADGPVLARGDEDSAARVAAEVADDPDRVPVWIAPTPKYVYTPVPVEQRPRHSIIIDDDARNAMAKAPPRTRPEPQDVGRTVAPRRIDARRDNDPFFRD